MDVVGKDHGAIPFCLLCCKYLYWLYAFIVISFAVRLLAVGFAVYYCRNKPKEQRDTALSAVVGKQAGEIYDDDVYETPAGVNM